MSELYDTAPPATVASQRIADHVREQILSGGLKPGARIRQDDLAEELSASRLPVREALRILQSAGLVTLQSNQGAWVTRLDQRDCERNYQIRERLEPLLLRESMPGSPPTTWPSSTTCRRGSRPRPTSRSSWSWTAPCTGRRTGTTRRAS